jgi:hypothetical protein
MHDVPKKDVLYNVYMRSGVLTTTTESTVFCDIIQCANISKEAVVSTFRGSYPTGGRSWFLRNVGIQLW